MDWLDCCRCLTVGTPRKDPPDPPPTQQGPLTLPPSYRTRAHAHARVATTNPGRVWRYLADGIRQVVLRLRPLRIGDVTEMKWNMLGALVFSVCLASQSFGYGLLDAMLGCGCGCDACDSQSCCEKSCGACDPGCGCEDP